MTVKGADRPPPRSERGQAGKLLEAANRRLKNQTAAWFMTLLVGLALAWPLFERGPLISGDNPSHLAEIYALQDTVLKQQGWWTGWFEGDFAGYPLLAYQYPLGKWLVVLLALSPGVDIPLAYKLLLFFSWLFPALALIRLIGRRIETFTPAAVVALLYLAAFDSLFLSLAGMWNQYLSAGIFLLTVDSMTRLVRRPTRRQTAITALWTAAAAISHPFLFLMLPLAWLSLLAVCLMERPGRSSSLIPFLTFPLISFLLTSWYFIPILMTFNWPQLVVVRLSWYDACSSLFPMVSSDLFRTEGTSPCLDPQILAFSLGMVLAVPVGMAGLIWIGLRLLERRPVDPLFSAALGVGIGIALWIGFVLAEPFSFLRQFAIAAGGGRLALYILLSLLLATAFLLEAISRSGMSPIRGRLLGLSIAMLLTPVLARGIASDQMPPVEARLLLSQAGPAGAELRQVGKIWQWLRENASAEDGRVLCQDTAYNLEGSSLYWSHLLALTHFETGLWALGPFGQNFFPTEQLTRTQGPMIFGERVGRILPDRLRAQMSLYNCRYAVTCEPLLERAFRESEDFALMFHEGPFALFRSIRSFGWAEWAAGAGRIEAETAGQGQYVLQVNVTSEEPAVLRIKSSFHPWWRVRVNGVPEQPQRSEPDQLLMVPLPESGDHSIKLEFRPPRLAPIMFTFAGFGWLILLLFRIPSSGFRVPGSEL